ncbi:MAG: relaxase/mobilization nuclease domain-containing protein [Eubacteriales bacterium]|nr:relaxase/mobilization nuclease domain-containing protein [Eubacteriales bacterium]
MATTRIISMHVNQGKTVAKCLADRTEYAKNPEKTRGGEMVSSYSCDAKTADAEFLFAKRQYHTLTGRAYKNDVIAYQIRQSFKSGEVTPEEANRLGYELAMRFLKGKHAFIVATHCDKKHVHNHIIFNSTTLDCQGKFRDFLGSGKAVARLSDLVCMEHHLSVIENPQRGNHSYNKWLGKQTTPSHRDLVRTAIDGALAKKPADFNAFLQLMMEAGYSVKRGAHIAFRCDAQKQSIRLRSLGVGYSEDELRAVIAGERAHMPRKKYSVTVLQKSSLLIDVEAKMRAGQGRGYQNWAKVFNLKQMAQTMAYLQEHHLLDYAELTQKVEDDSSRYNHLSTTIRGAEKRMAEIAALKTHIINYSKTRDVYAAYRKAGYSKKYLAEHEVEIILHKAAKKAFDDLGVKKLPTIKNLQAEYVELLSTKKAAYAEYRAARDEMKELLVHRANVDRILENGKVEANKIER